MTVYNLPPVDRKTLPDAGPPGQWQPIDLDALAGSLSIDEQQARPDQLKSIPDAWAQIQTAADALLANRHDARDAVIAQWRGLLALLALQPLYKAEYELRITPAGFDKASRGASNLRKILVDLLPLQTLTQGMTWKQLAMIEVIAHDSDHAEPVALTSPMTLVAASRMAGTAALPVPWGRAGLTDPTDEHIRDTVSLEAWPVLDLYLGKLIEAVRKGRVADGQSENRDRLLKHLADYRAACAVLGQTGRTLEPVKLSGEWGHKFFSPLGNTALPEPQRGSQCRIRLHPVHRCGVGGAILVDPALADHFGRPANQIMVWDRYSLEDAQSPATLNVIRGLAAKQQVLVLQPEDFFTAELVRLKGDATVRAHHGGFEQALLPLAPIALLFTDNGTDLAARTTWSNRGSGDVEVALALTLEDDQGNERNHRIRRLYRSADIATMPAPDDLAVWPDFHSNRWPWTFLRFQYTPRSDLETRFGATAELISRDVMKVRQEERLARLAEWSSSHGRTVERRLMPSRVSSYDDADKRRLFRAVRPHESDSLVSGFQETSAGIDAIFFCHRRSDATLPAGCIAVVRAEPERQGNEAARVAFDFGTTNTISFLEIGENKEPVAFGEQVHFPIKQSVEDEARKSSAYTSFFPIHAQDMPLPSVAKKRDFGQQTDELSALEDRWDCRVGFSHFAFFMPRAEQGIGSDLMISLVEEGKLHFDLKWGKEGRTNLVVESFIGQLMMMTLAEIVMRGGSRRRTTWYFSYPQSFDGQLRNDFSTIIHSALRGLFDEVGEAHEGELKLVTEGEAAATYFMGDYEKRDRENDKLMLMLDIGGGSTDMAIWKQRKLVWRGSIELAGGHFFRRYLVNNFEMLAPLEPRAVSQILKSKPTSSSMAADKRKRQLVDLLVARPGFSEQFAKQLAVNKQDPLWQGLMHCATVMIGGTLYFAGQVMHGLREAGKLTLTDLNDLTVAFGGRGSTLFRQFDPLGGAREALSDICAMAILSAGGDPNQAIVTPDFSNNPKEEVVRGLLLPPLLDGKLQGEAAPATQRRRIFRKEGDPVADNSTDKAGVDTWLPIGLELEVQPGAAGGDAQLAATDSLVKLLDAARVNEIGMASFDTFLDALYQLSGLTIDLASAKGNARLPQGTQAKINTAIATLPPEHRKARDVQTIEPPFVTMLKRLVELMSESHAERDATIKVRS